MQNLFRWSNALISEVNIEFTRYLYEVIKWDDRLGGITAAHRIGKTTLMIHSIHITNFRLLKNCFIVKDDIEIGHRNFIPLWLFGFLY